MMFELAHFIDLTIVNTISKQAFLALSFDRKSIFEKYQMENKMARCKLRKHNREIQMTLQGQWEKRGYERRKKNNI